MSVGEDAPGHRRRVAPARTWLAPLALVALLTAAAAACGDGEQPSDEASFGASSASSSAPSTTAEPVGTPFPDGVYQWTINADDWTEAGLPADTDADVAFHVATFSGGTAYDVVALDDGTRQTAAQWRYAPSGDQQITLTDAEGRTTVLEWELTGDELHFTMPPDGGEPRDQVLWTAQTLRKVG